MTLCLSLPMVFMAPSETASQSPTNEVTIAQDRISSQFETPIHEVPLVVEAVDGNILSHQSLLALYERSQAVRSDPDVGGFLAQRYIPELDADSGGVFTIADAVDLALRENGTDLTIAQPDQVAAVVSELVDGAGAHAWGLAQQAERGVGGRWVAPALIVAVDADNAALGGGGSFVAIGAEDLTKEEYSRDVLELFRADTADIRSWTVATDVNLTSIEQGTRAGPFIGATVFVVLLVLLLVFRSYWLTAIAGLALGASMIWLKGLANLIGLENDQLLAVIVPIGMISFGVDSTFHVYGRWQEQSNAKSSPRRAFRLGTAAVLSPIALALSSDSAAFLANVTSPIESVRQFGIAAALAACAAFLLMGIIAPLAVSEVEERCGPSPTIRWGSNGDLALGALAASLATAATLLIVFVSPVAGTVTLVGYAIVAIGLPVRAARKRPAAEPASRRVDNGNAPLATLVERVATGFGAKPLSTMFTAAGLSGFVLFFAVQVKPSFEVTDFFSPDVDFVVGIDKVTTYAGTQTGEPATILVEADLSRQGALVATASFVDSLRALDSDLLARNSGGTIVHGGLVDLVRDAMDPRNRIPNGTRLPDADLDGLPDSEQDLRTLVAAVRADGVVNADGRFVWTPKAVGTVIGVDETGTAKASQVGIEMPDTSTQENVTAVREMIEPRAAGLEAELIVFDPTASVTLTGSPIFRDEQLQAIIRSLLFSLPVAVAICVALVSAFTRSLRLAILTTIPVLLVVTWLYGFMSIAGYGINVVTATIGAISIGVGIDFATHMTMRMVEEHRRHHSQRIALAAAMRGTGTALVGAAATSMIGFMVLALAPMPMFATYGLLTAMMIVFSMLASVVVLPSLLILFADLDGPSG